MAIMVEQDKKPINWINAVAIVVFVALVFAVAYFILFNKPQFIDVVLPGSLSNIKTLSQVQVDPTPVVNSLQKYFTTNYGSSLTIPTPGRTNPFAPF